MGIHGLMLSAFRRQHKGEVRTPLPIIVWSSCGLV